MGEIDNMKAARAAIADSLIKKQAAVVDAIVARVTARIGSLDIDPALSELLEASVAGNVSVYFQLLTDESIAPDSLQAPIAAVEYATRIAQRDVPVSALNRAYHLGQNVLLRYTMDEVDQWDIPGEQKVDIIRYIADRLDLHSDWILRIVIEIYEVEKRRWWSNHATMNAAVIRRVLRGESISPGSFLDQTDYNIELFHLALIAWFPDDDDNVAMRQRNVDGLFRRLAALLRSPSPALSTAADGHTAWGWIGLERTGLPLRIRKIIDNEVMAMHGVRVALGVSSRAGADGFKDAHEQARIAQFVATSAAKQYSGAVVASNDPEVGLIAIMLKNREMTAMWLEQVLGEFSKPGKSHASVRETLNIYYATNLNSSRTAQILGIHRNTVKRRIDRFEKALQRSTGSSSSVELALALKLHEIMSHQVVPEE
jgi:hypothetical protein